MGCADFAHSKISVLPVFAHTPLPWLNKNMGNDAARDIRRILNVVLALEAAFKASARDQNQQPAKPAVPKPFKPSKPKPIKRILPIKPVGPQPNKPRI